MQQKNIYTLIQFNDARFLKFQKYKFNINKILYLVASSSLIVVDIGIGSNIDYLRPHLIKLNSYNDRKQKIS